MNDDFKEFLRQQKAAQELFEQHNTSRLMRSYEEAQKALLRSPIQEAIQQASRVYESLRASSEAMTAALSSPATEMARRMAEESASLVDAYTSAYRSLSGMGDLGRSTTEMVRASQSLFQQMEVATLGGLVLGAGVSGTGLIQTSTAVVESQSAAIGREDDEDRPRTVPVALKLVAPGVGLFAQTLALRNVTPHRALQEQDAEAVEALRLEMGPAVRDFLQRHLADLKPAFRVQHQAAIAPVDGRRPDWWTQQSASLRKLVKGVWHTAAPTDVVLPWAVQARERLDDKNRPTRKAKAEWLCAGLDPTWSHIVRAELESVLPLIDLLDKAQHLDDFPEFEAQYEVTLFRFEVALAHILAIWLERARARR